MKNPWRAATEPVTAILYGSTASQLHHVNAGRPSGTVLLPIVLQLLHGPGAGRRLPADTALSSVQGDSSSAARAGHVWVQPGLPVACT